MSEVLPLVWVLQPTQRVSERPAQEDAEKSRMMTGPVTDEATMTWQKAQRSSTEQALPELSVSENVVSPVRWTAPPSEEAQQSANTQPSIEIAHA
jgi:hypothetical protein